MYLLRRTAARAINSTPSKTLFVKPRSITTYTPAFQTRQQQCIASSFQRRFASDDAARTDSAEAAAAAAQEQMQTRPEAPIEENLTPAQQSMQADPQDASATVGIDALESAVEGNRIRRPATQAPPPPGLTLYVGNLYYEVTEDQLKRIFSRFGEVKSVKLVMDNRGLSRGFAYVEYGNLDDAKAAIDNLDTQVFEGRNLVVQFHNPKPRKQFGRTDIKPNEPSKVLFIGNMSFEMSDKDLNDLFRDIRNVMDVRVAIDRRTGQPRGFAHADFVDVASAVKAKEQLQDKEFYGRRLRIDFSQPGTKTQGNREGFNPRRERRDYNGNGNNQESMQ